MINELIMLSNVVLSNVVGVIPLYVLMIMLCPRLLDMMFSIAMDEAQTMDVIFLVVIFRAVFIMN